MKNILNIFIVALSISALAQNRAIKFERGTWDEIKAKAKAENKAIFLDAYTSWCGPCKRMAKNTFTNDTVADYYNANFINAKIDMEVGEGKDIAEMYNVKVYPSLLFIDGNGNIVHRAVGYRNVPEFTALGKDAQNPEKQFAAMQKKYDAGVRDFNFMSQYMGTNHRMGLPVKKELAVWFDTQKENELASAQNWYMIKNFLSDMNSKECKYLLNNYNTYSQKYGEDSVNIVLERIYLDSCYRIIYNSKADKSKLSDLKTAIKNSGYKNAEKVILTAEMEYAYKEKDWTKYAEAAIPLLEKYHIKDPNMLNNLTYNFYSQPITDAKLLQKAEELSKISNDLDKNNPLFMDTYACLMFKNGKKEQASKLEKQALDLLKQKPENYSVEMLKEFEENVEKFKK